MEQEHVFDLEPEQEAELLERLDAVDNERKHPLEEAEKRSWKFLTELKSLNELTKKSA